MKGDKKSEQRSLFSKKGS